MPPADVPPPPPCIAFERRDGRPESMGSIVSELFPIRAHWARPGDRAKAELMLSAAELAWQVQVLELGFEAPFLPDGVHGPELDLYLAPLGPFEAYAFSALEVDQAPGDGLSSVPAYVAIDQDLPDAWLPSYTAHEFNHVLQYATDFTEYTLPIWEGVATAAQKWTLGHDGLWDDDSVVYFQEAPWAPTLVGDSYVLWEHWGVGWAFEYGTALWVMHLDEVLGDGDGRAGARLWRAAANEGWSYEPDAVDAVVEVSGQDLGPFLNGVARTRWLAGGEWDPRGLADAETWDATRQVPLDHSLTGDDLPVVVIPAEPPHITGQVFVEVNAHDPERPLEVAVTSRRGLGTGLLVLWWGPDGAPGEAQASGVDPHVSVTGAVRAVVAVSNLGHARWDGDDDPYVPGDQRIHLGALAEAPRGACGCATRAGGAPWVASVALLALGRRRARPTGVGA